MFCDFFLSPSVFCEMMRVAVSLAALASASAFAPISAPTGLQLRVNNVARAPRTAGEPFLLFTFMFSSQYFQKPKVTHWQRESLCGCIEMKRRFLRRLYMIAQNIPWHDGAEILEAT